MSDTAHCVLAQVPDYRLPGGRLSGLIGRPLYAGPGANPDLVQAVIEDVLAQAGVTFEQVRVLAQLTPGGAEIINWTVR